MLEAVLVLLILLYFVRIMAIVQHIKKPWLPIRMLGIKRTGKKKHAILGV